MALKVRTAKDLAKLIDYTLLKPEATKKEISKLCQEAKRYGFASVFVNPCYVKLASRLLKNSEVKVGTVVGFPLGANTFSTKAFEAREAIKLGASEIDMVINVGFLKSADLKLVQQDIEEVAKVVRQMGDKADKNIVFKVIIETCFLNQEEKVKAAQLAEKAGAEFVKTSTGFGTAGANLNDVKLLRKHLSDKVKIKASGGIRTFEQALDMLKAGADRIGTSSGVMIIKEAQKKLKAEAKRAEALEELNNG